MSGRFGNGFGALFLLTAYLLLFVPAASSQVAERTQPEAEPDLLAAIQRDPTNTEAIYSLAHALLAQQRVHPEKVSRALFAYARAAYYSGPGALPEQTRRQVEAFVTKAYKTYHGSSEGFDELVTLARARALPPDGFRIRGLLEPDGVPAPQPARKAAQVDRQLALWREIRYAIIGENAKPYWDALEGPFIPGGITGVEKFKGKLVAALPEKNPVVLLVAVDGGAADARIQLVEALPGSMQVGSEIRFSGTAVEYVKKPYLLTLESNSEEIEGWKEK